ncbi:MAG: NusG domain II-containing protein [Agathobacter sp.]|nr:NusG domain II-containing protein [Agathobacter sp.]
MDAKNQKKNDIFVILILLIVALAFGLGYSIYQNQTTTNPEAVITVDGQEYGRFPLDEPRTLHIDHKNGGYNVIVIADGAVDITEASCPDHICVNHRKAHKNKDTITCLPNNLIVIIENGEESDVDIMGN